MARAGQVVCVVVVAVVGIETAEGDSRRQLEYAPAPVDNPLKGLVPYQADVRDRFPHSLEFNYIPYSTLVKGYDEFDYIDRVLAGTARAGRLSTQVLLGSCHGCRLLWKELADR